MKYFNNIFTTKGDSIGLFFQLSFCALFAMMSLFSRQTSAQTRGSIPIETPQTCTPSTTVSDGDLLPGGIASFGVSSGPGSVTIDHINAGTGLQSITMVDMSTPVVMSIPAFARGTTAPVVVNFTTPNPGLGADFTLRAANSFYSIFIRVRCAQTCTPFTTVSEGDLAPGGIASFGVSSGPGSVTVDHINAGTGLQSLTVVGAPTNATMNIPAYAPDTFAPVDVNFTRPDPALPTDFTLRAASKFYSIFIRVRCSATTNQPEPDNGELQEQ